MKANSKLIVSIVPCLFLVFSGQAAMQTTLDWEFSTWGTTLTNGDTVVLPTTTINPSEGDAMATVHGPNTTYYFGVGPQPITGSPLPTGLWEVLLGDITLSLDNRTSASPVTYTLEITQFRDNNFYPGNVTFSAQGYQLPIPTFSQTVVIPQTGDMTGSWFRDVYQWTSVDLQNEPIDLTIGPANVGGGLLVDELKFVINGDLIPVPEPATSQIAAAGLLAFALRHWARRKSAPSRGSAS